ncbi:AcrR family transcriptional regulator [Chitinivorax tropicus]|uniref:AcrR family transcriptional regulator n=1 Tax=Chitinivorax tropicus TaxID=714531 RepID=A0A840MMZ2_9PROT|nr:TetR/AcrR family transcriptional regulator [Chitinivorax tropicus]MBB5017876.1 AcrR family transcriptional regulator [Chitinivorax tropicus]
MARIRAIDDDEKKLKRQSILDAALRLYHDNTRELPSVSRIAEACGLAKGTVYLYFKTKEEIFLALLEEGFHRVLREIEQVVTEHATQPQALLDAYVNRYVAQVADQPDFLRLAAMTNAVLEQNLDQQIALQFKAELLRQLGQLGARLEQALPALNPGDGHRLLSRTYALTIGLWQVLDWPENVRCLVEQEEFRHARPDFFNELSIALRQLLKGALPI